MHIITVSSIKGGVSKTSLVAGLSQVYKKSKYSVLAIDLDPNNNLSDYFLRKYEPKPIWMANAYHFLSKKKTIEECIHQSNDFVDVIPSTSELQKIGTELAGDPGSLLRIKSALKKLSYDVILIDTPPYLGYEIRAGLYSADTVLTPLAPVRWNLQALAILQEELKLIEDTIGQKPQLLCVPSMVTEAANNKIRGYKSFNLTKSWISNSQAIYHAQKRGLPISEKSKSWKQFNDLAKEILADA